MQGRDQTRTHPIGSVGVEVDLQGITPGGGELATVTPIGGGIVAVDDGAHRRFVELDPQAPLLAQGGDGVGHHQVPVVLVGDAGVHRRLAVESHRFAAGAGTGNALGVGMAGQYQDGGVATDRPQADPVLALGAAHTGERVIGQGLAAGLVGLDGAQHQGLLLGPGHQGQDRAEQQAGGDQAPDGEGHGGVRSENGAGHRRWPTQDGGPVRLPWRSTRRGGPVV